MRRNLVFSLAVIALACSSPRSQRVQSDVTPASVCAGYEDVLALPERPFTPCELEAQPRPSRTVSNPWPASYSGPCQFVDIRVVVDSAGQLEPGSPSVRGTNVPGIAANVVKAMTEAQYVPGRRAGRSVRSVRTFHFASPNAVGRCER